MVKNLPLFTVALATLLILSCSHNKTETEPSSNSTFSSIGEQISSSDLEQYYNQQAPTDLLGQLTQEIYKKRDYEPIWFPNGSVSYAFAELHDILSHAYQWGLNPCNYPLEYNPSVDLKTREAAVTRAAVTFFSHVSFGAVRTKSIFTEHEHLFFRQQMSDALLSAIETGNFLSALAHVQPSFPQYSRLQKATSLMEFPPYQTLPFGFPNQSPIDSTFWSLFGQMGYDIDALPKNKASQRKLVSSFQKASGLKVTGKCDFDTYALLLKNRYEWFSLVELNLERLRQNPPLTNTYVWVNIPSFRLEMVQSGKPIHTTRVVVGAPTTPTPVLSGKISHIITYPSWNIPTSIIRKEIIPAMRRDSAYLAKKGYRVATWSGQALPHSSVLQGAANSEHLPYNVSQPPGTDNALGTLKFLFNNSESVYLHDTNAKSYFARNYRALSHGCVRVHEPHRLAELLLDSTLVAQMDKQLANRTSGHIALKKEVGVYLRYITCDVLANGSLVRYDDVYHQDNFDRHRMEQSIEALALPNMR